jgi:putative flippase GtrA
MRPDWQSWWRLPLKLRFLLAGGFNTAVGYLLFSGLFLLVGRWVHYLVIGLVAHALSVVNAFVVHRKLVFRATDDWRPAFIRFNVSQLVSLGFGLAALYGLVEFGHCNPLAAQFAVTLMSVVLNYLLHRNFSFRKAAGAAGGRVP